MKDLDKVRASAVKIVFEVNERGAYSNIALNKELTNQKFNDLDRRFCTELVYGTIKAGYSIDWIISKYINRPFKKIDPKVLAILRVGMYQLFFLDKIPKHSAVDESVKIAKKISLNSSKFVNAILRESIRNPIAFPNDDSAESIAIRMLHPQWLIEKWIEQFGIEATKKICEFDNEEPPLTLRTNQLKISRTELIERLKLRGIKVEESKLVEEGIICRNINSMNNLKELQEGLCQVQDESSMLAVKELNPQPNELIIDCCAAPGGKSTFIAELMKDKGKILSFDIHEHKIAQIESNAKRLGIKIIEPKLKDAREIGEEYKMQADRVLADVPCSGLGVLRRKADLRWQKNLNEIKELPKLQLEILKSVAKAVKVGGTLIYSTCTLEQAENEDVVEKFIELNDEFELKHMRTILPHIDGTDGFFIARLIRR